MTEPGQAQQPPLFAPPSEPSRPVGVPGHPPPGAPGYPPRGMPGYPAQPAWPGPVPGYPYPLAAPTTIAVLPDGSQLPRTAHVDQVQGTPFGLALLRVPPTVSGAAIGSLVGGIVAVLVSFVVGSLGLGAAVAEEDGPALAAVAGAFGILCAAFGTGGVVFGVAGMRQVRRGAGRITGRGMAIAGIACGCCAVLLAGLAVVGSLAAQAGG